MFVRHDGQWAPLAPAYNGSFCMLQQLRHYFKLQLGEKTGLEEGTGRGELGGLEGDMGEKEIGKGRERARGGGL